MISRIKLWLKGQRVRLCNHQPPWDVLDTAADIYWSAPICLEFRKASSRPPCETPLGFGFWSNARIIKCRKCGGVFNEIKLGELWLKELESKKEPYLTPYEIDELEKECGWFLLQ